jgi:ribosome maturation factor RimP
VQESSTDENLQEIIEPIINGLGFKLVELKARPVKSIIEVSVVIYNPEASITVQNCTQVSRAIHPKLELIYSTESLVKPIRLEVSSPGLTRNLKSMHELSIFVNRGIQVLIDSEWVPGIIQKTENDILFLKKGEEILEIPFLKVQKARLDYTQEVR